MTILRKTNLVAFLAIISSQSFANEQCNFDSKLALRIAYSTGEYDVTKDGVKNELSETHNNASRIGGSVGYNCGETTLKYTYHTVIKLPGTSLKTNTIINKFSIANKSLGKLTIGKITTPYKAAGKKGDYFWDTPAGTAFAANNFGYSDMTRGFTDNAVIYTSPKFGQFKFDVGYTGENSDGDYHVGVEYQEDNTVFGVQYLDLGDDAFVANHKGSKEAVRLYTRYGFDSWSFSGSLEDVRQSDGEHERFLNVSVQKKLESFGRVAMSYGQINDATLKLMDGSIQSGNGRGFSAGAFYNWAKDSEIYLLTSLLNFDGDNKQTSVALGINYHFSL